MIQGLSASAVEWRRERTRPFHPSSCKNGVRDSNGIDAAETFDHRHSRVIERSDAIPQDIAVVRAHEQRADR